MSVNLTIDQGNSAAKVAIWDGDRLMSQMFCHPLTEDDIDAIVSSHPLEGAIYCSVAQSGDEPLRWLTSRGVNALDLSHSTPLPIAIGYTTPATLGLDRVAAAVGAWARHQGRLLLVVDIGTAITYDVVSPEGRFIGGNIAPGPWMRLQSLHHFTARLPKVSEEGTVEMWGTDTHGAMRAGAIRGIVGEINHYRLSLGKDAVTVITGGDARLVTPMLDFQFDSAPNLVSEGLNRILQHNEDK